MLDIVYDWWQGTAGAGGIAVFSFRCLGSACVCRFFLSDASAVDGGETCAECDYGTGAFCRIGGMEAGLQGAIEGTADSGIGAQCGRIECGGGAVDHGKGEQAARVEQLRLQHECGIHLSGQRNA